MNLSTSQKFNLLNQLKFLSQDEQVLPYIDEQTASRIQTILKQNQSYEFNEQHEDLYKSMTKKTHKTEIDEINQLYQEKFPNLFEDQQFSALKQIDVNLLNDRNKSNRNNKSSTKLNNKTSFNKCEKENVMSFGSTSQKVSTQRINDSSTKLNSTCKRKSKERLISYKIGTETPKLKKHHQSQSSQKLLKSKQKTLHKISTTHNSRSNLQLKQPNTNLKRTQSQKSKFNMTSLNSTCKQQKLINLKASESKGSLHSTSKMKPVFKKSLQQTSKRMLKSFSSIQIQLNNGKNGLSQTSTGNQNKSKEKISKKKEMLKKINKINTEYSIEKPKANQKPLFDEDLQEERNTKYSQKSSMQIQSRVITQATPSNLQFDEKRIQLSSDSESHYYLKQIISQIYNKQQQKLQEKVRLQQKIIKLKEKVLFQGKRLQQVNNNNIKIQQQTESIVQFHASVAQQYEKIQKSLYETKRKIKSLQHQIKENKNIYKKLANEQVQQEQQLIQMYENVIHQLRKEIKQQTKKKQEIKAQLQKVNKKLDSKQASFNSTLISTQKIKLDLGDAFREWV